MTYMASSTSILDLLLKKYPKDFTSHLQLPLLCGFCSSSIFKRVRNFSVFLDGSNAMISVHFTNYQSMCLNFFLINSEYFISSCWFICFSSYLLKCFHLLLNHFSNYKAWDGIIQKSFIFAFNKSQSIFNENRLFSLTCLTWSFF